MKKLSMYSSLILLIVMIFIQCYIIKNNDSLNNTNTKITFKETKKGSMDINNLEVESINPTFILKEIDKNKDYVNLCYNIKGGLKDINEGIKYFLDFNGSIEKLSGSVEEENNFNGEIIIRINR